jgi:hypothetical protein
MLRVFIGHEPRVAIQTNVAISSVYEHSSQPVAITPLVLGQLPITRKGLTEFSYARFLVPYLCGYKGRALFIDSDIAVLGDIDELFESVEDQSGAVFVADIKPEFERAAVMLFNCGHPDNRVLTPEFVETTNVHLHLLGWTQNIGFIPLNWGHAVGYSRPQPLDRLPLIHYTAGVPAWPETADCEHAEEWHKARRQMCSVKTTWADLIGKSVHSRPGPEGKPLPRWKVQDGALDKS